MSPHEPRSETATSADGASAIRVFVGTDDSQIVAHKVLEYSIRKHTQRALEFVPMHNIDIPVPSDPDKRPRTGFSFYRFLIPSLCGYRGRAIYLDADMLVVSDLTELFDTPFDGKTLLCTNQPSPPPGWEGNPHFQPGPHYAVMLLDCDRLRWRLDEIVAKLDAGELDYLDLMARMRIVPEEQIGTSLPVAWNSLEHHVAGETKLIHYTVVPTQPWKSLANPHEGIWLDYFREALRVGAVSLDDVQRGFQDGHLTLRLLEIANEECAAPAPVKAPLVPIAESPGALTEIGSWLKPLVPSGNR